MTSVRSPSEMARWTIHQAAGVTYSKFPNFTDTLFEQIQKDYVRDKLKNESLSVISSMDFHTRRGINFLTAVGTQIGEYLEYLKRIPKSEQEAQRVLDRTVRDLLKEKDLVLMKSFSLSDPLKLGAQIDTAYKIILLFAKQMQEELPRYCEETQDSLEKIHQSRKKIAALQIQYSQEAVSLYNDLKSLNSRLLEQIECNVQNRESDLSLHAMREQKGRTIVKFVQDEVENFIGFFENRPLHKIIKNFEYEKVKKRFVKVREAVSDTKKLVSSSCPLFIQLTLAGEMIDCVKKLVDLMGNCQQVMLRAERIKESNKHYILENLPNRLKTDLFENICEIEDPIEEGDDDLLFHLEEDCKPLSINWPQESVVINNPEVRLGAPSSRAVGNDTPPVTVKRNSRVETHTCTEPEGMEKHVEARLIKSPKVPVLIRHKFQEESILRKWMREEEASPDFQQEEIRNHLEVTSAEKKSHPKTLAAEDRDVSAVDEPFSTESLGDDDDLLFVMD
jgi:hypothetical protein